MESWLVVVPRYTAPAKDLQLLLEQLRLRPFQATAAARITARCRFRRIVACGAQPLTLYEDP